NNIVHHLQPSSECVRLPDLGALGKENTRALCSLHYKLRLRGEIRVRQGNCAPCVPDKDVEVGRLRCAHAPRNNHGTTGAGANSHGPLYKAGSLRSVRLNWKPPRVRPLPEAVTSRSESDAAVANTYFVQVP